MDEQARGGDDLVRDDLARDGSARDGSARDGSARDDLARDEDDHDLLTFTESAIRLREEIASTETALREASAPELRAALSARLGALTDALRRNTRQAGASPGETGFLDYAPPRRADAPGQARS